MGSVNDVAIQRDRRIAQLTPFRPGEARARELGRAGALTNLRGIARRKHLVELMEAGLEAGLLAIRGEFSELSAKVASGKKLTRTEKRLMLTIGELLLKHCRHILPQEVVAQVSVVEPPPSLSPEEVVALRENWQRVQESGLLGEGGRPVGAPEDYIDGEVVADGCTLKAGF